MYIPEDHQEVRGVVQVVHGKSECIRRYEYFMRYLANKGYVAIGADHVGHGQSTTDPTQRGYFAKENGYQNLITDTHSVTTYAKELYPDKKITLLGHSMGSMVARLYVVKTDYVKDIDSAIFLGSPTPDKTADIGIQIGNLIRKMRGERYISPLLINSSTGKYNNHFKPARTSRDWLTRDEDMVDDAFTYTENDFEFTTSAFIDLFKMSQLSNCEAWFKYFPKELPCLFMTGMKDPVTNFGYGTMQVCKKLEKYGVKQGDFKGYFNARHELLNEINREQVYKDIILWIEFNT